MLEHPHKVKWVMTLPERTCRHQLSQMLKGVKSPENGERTEVKPGPEAYLHILHLIPSSSEIQVEHSCLITRKTRALDMPHVLNKDSNASV